MIQLCFGLGFDESNGHRPKISQSGTLYVGPQKLLNYFSAYWGIPKPHIGTLYLRLEQYRQAVKAHLAESQEEVFYESSFSLNSFAVAKDLLNRRDELLLSGWVFTVDASTPDRLKTLAEIESIYQSIISKNDRRFLGFADRWDQLIKLVKRKQEFPIDQIIVFEPASIWPPHVTILFEELQRNGVQIKTQEFSESIVIEAASDLQKFKQLLFKGHSERKTKMTLDGDGSLILLKGRNESLIARYLAKILSNNPGFRPEFLIPIGCNVLDDAFIQEGLPSFGIRNASLARPSMQVLKLVTLFLWRPVDPYKLLEFVSLLIKPLHDLLAQRIANFIIQKPGVKGEGWKAMIQIALHEIEQDDSLTLSQKKEIRYQYHFWFERKQYDSAKTAPKIEVIGIFEYLEEWALQLFREQGERDESIFMLSLQAKQTKELLQALPEDHLTYLEVERIVKTIYDSTSIQRRPLEQNYYPYAHQQISFYQPIKHLVWWNFVDQEADLFFAKWYGEELNYFKALGIKLETPAEKNKKLNWQRKWPVFLTQDQLIFCLPEQVQGIESILHPLKSNLDAAFENINAIEVEVENLEDLASLVTSFNLPDKVALPLKQLNAPKAYIELDQPLDFSLYEKASPSSLENLLYYPHKWFFRHYLKINKSPILSIVDLPTLLGNLGHRFIECILEEDLSKYSQESLHEKVEELSQQLLPSEGAVLLMYGMEPEKVNFLNTIKFSAWKLINLLRDNNWSIFGKELNLGNQLFGIQVNGRADLVLHRGNDKTIVDLKWRGLTYRKQMIKNEEDIQLVLYAKLLQQNKSWPITAFYIIQSGQMLIRDNSAFKQVEPLNSQEKNEEVLERIFEVIETTFDWRKEQLEKGWLEIRTESTYGALENIYGAKLLEVLEMKKSNAAFDDYSVLIGL